MIFITILTLIVAKALPVINNNLSTLHFTRISSLVLFISAILSIQVLNIQSIGTGIGLYSGLFHINHLNLYIEIFILIIGGLILIGWPMYSIPTLEGEKTNLKRVDVTIYKSGINYSIVILFSILGSILLLSSSDLISLYLSLELQSFGLYILSTLHRDSYSSTSSGLKYFLLGGLSSCIILLGIALIYVYTGLTQYESLYLLNTHIAYNDSIQPLLAASQGQELNIGILLIFIGLLFKIAAAPLHNWSPDVYDGTPTIVTTYLTIIPKLSILIIMLELLYLNQPILNTLNNTGILNIINTSTLPSLLLISSLLSLIIGSLLGLSQIKIKRLLAYSTISHIGFILLAISINTSQSIDSFIFYILQYTLTNLNVFLIILAYSYLKCIKNMNNAENIKDINYINELKGYFYSYPLLSISLSICLFSMAGIPPLVGFFSKQFVLYAALQNGYYLISLIGILVSVISASYYLKIVKLIMTPTDSLHNEETEKHTLVRVSGKVSSETYLSNIHSYLISSLTLFILLFFINPSIILNSTQLLSLTIFYI